MDILSVTGQAVETDFDHHYERMLSEQAPHDRLVTPGGAGCILGRSRLHTLAVEKSEPS